MNIMFVASDNKISGAFLSMVRLTTILKEKYHHNILVILPRKSKRRDDAAFSGKQLLDKNGIQNVIIPSCTWTAALEEEGGYSPKQFIKVLVGWVISLYSVPQISKLIRRENIDLVHINTSWTYVGALAALRTGTPFVWHIREFLEEDQNRQIVNKQRGYELMKKADKVIAISESIYKKYAEILGSDKITTILNGIDTAEYLKPDHCIFQEDIINMVIVGNICKSKGQWVAIEACSILLKKGIANFKLRVVGRDLENHLRYLKDKVTKQNLERYVEFCGPSTNTAQYYQNADVALVCSKSEAFGRVTVEAMFGGALLIGADSAGTHDMIQDGETGLLFENENPESLADKLAYAFENREEMQVVAKKGQSFMLNNMTAEINAEKVNHLYAEIIGGGVEHCKVIVLVSSNITFAFSRIFDQTHLVQEMGCVV